MSRVGVWAQAVFVWALRHSPAFLRWFATRCGVADGLPGLEAAFLGMDQAGHITKPQGDANAHPHRVVVPVYLVMTPMSLAFGEATLWPLTEFCATQEAAARRHAQLVAKFPLSAVQSSLLTFDPVTQAAELEQHKRLLIVETLRNAR